MLFYFFFSVTYICSNFNKSFIFYWVLITSNDAWNVILTHCMWVYFIADLRMQRVFFDIIFIRYPLSSKNLLNMYFYVTRAPGTIYEKCKSTFPRMQYIKNILYSNICFVQYMFLLSIYWLVSINVVKGLFSM